MNQPNGGGFPRRRRARQAPATVGPPSWRESFDTSSKSDVVDRFDFRQRRLLHVYIACAASCRPQCLVPAVPAGRHVGTPRGRDDVCPAIILWAATSPCATWPTLKGTSPAHPPCCGRRTRPLHVFDDVTGRIGPRQSRARAPAPTGGRPAVVWSTPPAGWALDVCPPPRCQPAPHVLYDGAAPFHHPFLCWFRS